MQLAIKGGARCGHIGDVKHLLVGAAGKAGADYLPDEGTGSVASGEIAGITCFFLPVWAPKCGGHVIAGITEAKKLGFSFDGNIKRLEPLDKQSLVLILCI